AASQGSSASTGRAIPQRSRIGSWSARAAGGRPTTHAEIATIRTRRLTSPSRRDVEEPADEGAEGGGGDGRRLAPRARRSHAVLRRGPERPGERRRESLTAVVRMWKKLRICVAPGRASEDVEQARALGVVEQQEVDLMGELV